MVTTAVLVDDTPRALPVPGGKSIVFLPSDFTNRRAWERLCLGYELRGEDFKDLNMWKRYWYLAYSLTEGTIIVSGPEGSGKSQWMYYTAYHMRELFGKGCTFDIEPKDTFGPYRSIDDASFVEELSKFKEIAVMEKALERKDITREAFEEALNDVKLFNAVIGIDEAYDKLEKARRGNFAVNLGRLIRKYRHFHNLFILLSPDAKDIDRRMAWQRRTHEVHCYFDGIRGHPCRYNIWWRRPNNWTGQQLTPANWAFLWESENIIGTSVLPIKGHVADKEA